MADVNPNQPPPLLQRRRRWDRALLIVPIVIGVLFLSLCVAWGVFLWKVTVEQNRLLAECRERGEPVAPAELAMLYLPVDDADNAAIAFMKLWAEADPEFWEKFANRQRTQETLYHEKPPGIPLVSSEMPSVTYRRSWELQSEREPELRNPVLILTGEPLEAATEYVSERSNYVAALRRAANQPHCRFPIRFEDGGAMLLPHLSTLRADAKLLRLDALLAAERGNPTAALEDLVALDQIKRHVGEEPLLISLLVASSVADIWCNALEEFLSRIHPDEAMFSIINDSLTTFSVKNALRLTVLSERARWNGFSASCPMYRMIVCRFREGSERI